VRRALLVVLVAAISAASTDAPRHAPARGHYSAPIDYDGRFTLVRLRWGGRSQDAWSHGYPQAERDLSAIIRGLTYLDVHDDGNEILTLDDPDLFRYPVAVMWQPGFWTLTDREAESFRAYLLKGGFAIFQDVDGAGQWANFEKQIRRVLPDGRLTRLDPSHQIFSLFFRIEDCPSYYGIFEDNDPSKRLVLVADYQVDVPQRNTYTLGVNDMIYGLSH